MAIDIIARALAKAAGGSSTPAWAVEYFTGDIIGLFNGSISGGETINSASGRILFAPFFPRIKTAKTISRLGVRVTTAGLTGALARFGVYNFDPVTRRPTTLVCQTASVDVTAGGNWNWPVVANGVLQPGTPYFRCFHINDNTVRFNASGSSTTEFQELKPMRSWANVPSNTGDIAQTLRYDQAFGALPADLTLTSPNFEGTTGGGFNPLIAMWAEVV